MDIYLKLIFYKLRDFIVLNKIYSTVFILYILSVLIISPWGNYAIGDDLYYLFQIKSFQNGDFTKNSYIDTSIILQIFIGYGWSFLFGANFLSLRILTILFTLIFIFVLVKILKFLKFSNNLIIVTSLLLIFNPKIMFASLSFNSEIYFLTFLFSSFYFLLKFNEATKLKYLLYFSIIAGFSVWIRQLGFLMLFPALFVFYLNYKNLSKISLPKILGIFGIFITLSIVGILWPKHENPIHQTSLSLLSVINYNNISDKFFVLWKEIPYVSLILSPFVFFLLKNTNKISKILITILSLILAIFLFHENIFSIGNVLYLEGLYARGYPILREHLINNLVIKFILAFSFSIIFILAFNFVVKNISNFKSNKTVLLILFTCFVYLSSIFLAGVLYDRYFIYFELFFLIFFVSILNILKINLDRTTLFITSWYVIFSIFYSIDFHQDLKIKWKFANEISSERSVKLDEIFIQETFLKYAYIEKIKDYSGMYKIKPDYPEYKCYVSNDIVQNKNIFGTLFFLSSKAINKMNLLENKGIFEYGYNAGQLKQCKDCKILKEQGYFSPLYEVLGISKFVKAYCLDEKK